MSHRLSPETKCSNRVITGVRQVSTYSDGISLAALVTVVPSAS